jgi:hypothetical protein
MRVYPPHLLKYNIPYLVFKKPDIDKWLIDYLVITCSDLAVSFKTAARRMP